MSLIDRAIFLEALGEKVKQPDPPEVQDMSLVLREGSVINEALVDAQRKLKGRLIDAAKVYLEQLRSATMDQLVKMHESGNGLTPAELRATIQNRFGQVMEREQHAFKDWEAALATFDVGVKDLDAWVSAAKAADKFRPT